MKKGEMPTTPSSVKSDNRVRLNFANCSTPFNSEGRACSNAVHFVFEDIGALLQLISGHDQFLATAIGQARL